MTPFGDGEPFWKPPNVYDAAGVVGLVFAIASIWFSWWLAKRDIEGRLRRARRELLAEAYRRSVAEALTAARQSVELCHQAADLKAWKHAGLHAWAARLRVISLAGTGAVGTADRRSLMKIRVLSGLCVASNG